MNPWDLLAQAEKNPDMPFKVEVGEYSIARKPASKGKTGEPANNPNQGYSTNRGGTPWLTVPQFDRENFILDNRGNIINKNTGEPIARNPRNMPDITIAR